MPPRRSVRRNSGTAGPSYKKGDVVEFTINGSTAKGKILRKSTKGSGTSPLWIVAPNGRRRNEEIPEKDLLIVNETAPKSKRITRTSTGGTASSYSDDSLEDAAQAPITRRSTRGSGTGTGSSEEQSESSNKRKSDESDSTNRKLRKVTFSDGKRAAVAAAKKKKADKKKPASRAGNINTRSTRASGGELMPELPPASKPNKLIKTSSVPKVKKNENVKVIKMLTGTLYLYRGETRRAEFVRSKY